MLTAKQEKFVQNLLQGMSQREAYKNSFNAEKMSDKTIDSKACNLLKQDKVRARFNELRDKVEREAVLSAFEKRMILRQIATDKDCSKADRIRAIDCDNKMAGEYITRVEAEVNNEVTITVELTDE